MALPNNIESKAIELFRKRMEDVLTPEQLDDQMFLVRWIRAREMDLDKAEGMLRNAITWRKENNVDSILDKKIESYFFENYPRWTDGLCKEGRPVNSVAIGKWDVRKMIRDGRSKEFLEYITQGFEELMASAKRNNLERGPLKPDQPPVTQIFCIFNFDGFSFGQLTNYKAVHNLLEMGKIYEAYYPEVLHTCYFINCPRLISIVMALIRPILAPKTLAKVKVFGTKKEEWQQELLKYIDADQLQHSFGGTRGIIQT